MAKITLNDVGDLRDYTTALNIINTNTAAIETAFENTLSRDGTVPNTMTSNLDMNSHRVLNLLAPLNGSEPLRLTDANVLNGGGTIATFPVGGTTGQALVKVSSTDFDTTWGNTITSVGLALPADFTITGSPVTTSGTLTGAWATTPTGTGAVVRATSPTLVTPALGTPASGVATNLTGTASGLTAGNVTTNANLTGVITSTGNATSIASQTGTGTKFVVDTSPTLVTPVLGVATATTVNKVTITAPASSAILTLTDGTTVTGPAATGTIMTLGNTETVTGVKTYGSAGAVGRLKLAGTTSGTTTLDASATASGTLTLPAATDTLVGKATTDTLTNKTYDTAGTGNSFSINGLAATANTGTGAVVRATSPALTTPTGIVKGDVGLGNVANVDTTVAAINFLIDGGGSVLSTGTKGYLEIPFNCTINRATLLADQSGSVVVNVYKCTYAAFDPVTHPAVADKITASAPPTISSAKKSQDSTLTGWTTSVTAGDIIAYNVDSATTITRVTLSLKVAKT